MKNLIFLLNLALISLFSCQSVVAQPTPTVSTKHSDLEIERMISQYNTSHQRDIYPLANLQKQFNKDFPKAHDIDWEFGADIYEVEFEIGRTDYKAYYDNAANLIMYTLDLKESALPAIVKNAAMAKYPNYKFDDVKKIAKGSETLYKVEMKKDKSNDIKATFKHDGTFIDEFFD